MDDSEIESIALFVRNFLDRVNVYNSLPNGEKR